MAEMKIPPSDEEVRRRMQERRRREREKQEAELAERLRARRACDEELERLNREIDALKRRREEIFKKREGGDE